MEWLCVKWLCQMVQDWWPRKWNLDRDGILHPPIQLSNSENLHILVNSKNFEIIKQFNGNYNNFCFQIWFWIIRGSKKEEKYFSFWNYFEDVSKSKDSKQNQIKYVKQNNLSYFKTLDCRDFLRLLKNF